MPKTPLFIVTGASCVGKSSVVPYLRGLLPEFVVLDLHPDESLDSSILLGPVLQMAHQISMSDRGTVLVSTLTPEDVIESGYRELFSQVYFMNLHCSDEVRDLRLRDRGATPEIIWSNTRLAHRLLDSDNFSFSPPISTIDITAYSPEEAGKLIRKWVRNYWSSRYPLEIRAYT